MLCAAIVAGFHFHYAQWFIRWVGGEDQAQIENDIEIHQPYPSNHANSFYNKTNEAGKLKLHVKLKIYHAKNSLENGQGDLSTLNSCFWYFTIQRT